MVSTAVLANMRELASRGRAAGFFLKAITVSTWPFSCSITRLGSWLSRPGIGWLDSIRVAELSYNDLWNVAPRSRICNSALNERGVVRQGHFEDPVELVNPAKAFNLLLESYHRWQQSRLFSPVDLA